VERALDLEKCKSYLGYFSKSISQLLPFLASPKDISEPPRWTVCSWGKKKKLLTQVGFSLP